MPELREDKLLEPQLHGLGAAGEAEDRLAADESGNRAGEHSRRADLVVAELGEKRRERAQRPVEKRRNRLDGDVGRREPRPAREDHRVDAVAAEDLLHGAPDRLGLVGDDPPLRDPVPAAGDERFHDVPAAVIFLRARR